MGLGSVDNENGNTAPRHDCVGLNLGCGVGGDKLEWC